MLGFVIILLIVAGALFVLRKRVGSFIVWLIDS